MTILPNLYICTTILFGICAQMLLLDIRIKNLKNTRLLLFGIGNLMVLATNLILSLVLPVEHYMKIYILFVHIPIFFYILVYNRNIGSKSYFCPVYRSFFDLSRKPYSDRHFPNFQMASSSRVICCLHCRVCTSAPWY